MEMERCKSKPKMHKKAWVGAWNCSTADNAKQTYGFVSVLLKKQITNDVLYWKKSHSGFSNRNVTEKVVHCFNIVLAQNNGKDLCISFLSNQISISSMYSILQKCFHGTNNVLLKNALQLSSTYLNTFHKTNRKIALRRKGWIHLQLKECLWDIFCLHAWIAFCDAATEIQHLSAYKHALISKEWFARKLILNNLIF